MAATEHQKRIKFVQQSNSNDAGPKFIFVAQFYRLILSLDLIFGQQLSSLTSSYKEAPVVGSGENDEVLFGDQLFSESFNVFKELTRSSSCVSLRRFNFRIKRACPSVQVRQKSHFWFERTAVLGNEKYRWHLADMAYMNWVLRVLLAL